MLKEIASLIPEELIDELPKFLPIIKIIEENEDYKSVVKLLEDNNIKNITSLRDLRVFTMKQGDLAKRIEIYKDSNVLNYFGTNLYVLTYDPKKIMERISVCLKTERPIVDENGTFVFLGEDFDRVITNTSTSDVPQPMYASIDSTFSNASLIEQIKQNLSVKEPKMDSFIFDRYINLKEVYDRVLEAHQDILSDNQMSETDIMALASDPSISDSDIILASIINTMSVKSEDLESIRETINILLEERQKDTRRAA